MITTRMGQGMFTMACLSLALAVSSSGASADGMDGQAKVEDKELVFRHPGGHTIVIEGWGTDGLRVRITPDGVTQTSDWALSIPVTNQATVETKDATIRNGKISARISDVLMHRGYLQFYRHAGDKTIPILREVDYATWADNPGTRTFKSVGDGLFQCEQRFESRDGERFYGMGANATGRVNLKSCVIDLYQQPPVGAGHRLPALGCRGQLAA